MLRTTRIRRLNTINNRFRRLLVHSMQSLANLQRRSQVDTRRPIGINMSLTSVHIRDHHRHSHNNIQPATSGHNSILHILHCTLRPNSSQSHAFIRHDLSTSKHSISSTHLTIMPINSRPYLKPNMQTDFYARIQSNRNR